INQKKQALHNPRALHSAVLDLPRLSPALEGDNLRMAYLVHPFLLPIPLQPEKSFFATFFT
ncbi:MAG: hypothetical protein EBY83_07320, partial [Verrucomicrobia bacterium]|nr:hypothetical protein [Verrucomicrobiota bacterium]